MVNTDRAGFQNVEALEEFMTRPSPELIADLARAPGDLVILGVGGKMGPTLARLAKRAAPGRRVIGVARFSEAGLRAKLESQGIECIACDLLDRAALDRLPRAPNVVFMAGHKFGVAGGTAGSAAFTWAMNVGVPYMVADAFRDSRIVVFSTACVYPYAEVAGAGAREDTPTLPPAGDYATSCVGREKAFEYGFGLFPPAPRNGLPPEEKPGQQHDEGKRDRGNIEKFPGTSPRCRRRGHGALRCYPKRMLDELS